MSTQEIAARLHELFQHGKFAQAQEELFADDASSTESDMSGGRVTVKGREALKKKEHDFNGSIEEMHGGYSNPPQVYGNFIFLEMGIDATFKEHGHIVMTEMCKYEVKDGKIISEEFFY